MTATLVACAEGAVSPVTVRHPAHKAREGRIPGVFRPIRNDECRGAARSSRDASPFNRRVPLSAGCSGLPDGPPDGSRTGSAAEMLVLLGLDILT